VKIHEFGERGRGSIVLIHGAFMSWEIFRPATDILSRRYRIYAVALPGHDTTLQEDFTTIEGIAARIELTLVRYGLVSADVLYGVSVGGGIALRMLADGKIPVGRGIIDGGITPRDGGFSLSRLLFTPDWLAGERGRNGRAALDVAFPPERYDPAAIDRIYGVVRNMSDNTVRQISAESDSYSLPGRFPETGTEIEYWYGEAEEAKRRRDIEYVAAHIPGVTFRKIGGMAHAQYAISCPEQLAADIERRMR